MKWRKKENKRKVQKGKQNRLLKRCSEILDCLIIDKQTSALLDEIVLKGKEVPLELEIKKENVLNIQELEKMKPQVSPRCTFAPQRQRHIFWQCS